MSAFAFPVHPEYRRGTAGNRSPVLGALEKPANFRPLASSVWKVRKITVVTSASGPSQSSGRMAVFLTPRPGTPRAATSVFEPANGYKARSVPRKWNSTRIDRSDCAIAFHAAITRACNCCIDRRVKNLSRTLKSIDRIDCKRRADRS
jgi:hypothetical protein